MKCDCCKKEFYSDDNILCENGFIYHKSCNFNPYQRHKNIELGDKVYIVWAVRKGEDLKGSTLELPWIYGVFKDDEKALFIQDYMQSSKEYGHLYWGHNFTRIK